MHPVSLTIYLHDAVVSVMYAQGATVVCRHTIPLRETAKRLVVTIDTCLKEVGIELSALSYIACHRGPGSFTTIRSMIVTVNGISYVTKIPLIGIESVATLGEDANHTLARAVKTGFERWQEPALRSSQLVPLYY